MSSQLTPIEIESITPLHNDVIVSDMKFTERVTSSGIVLVSDDGKLHGIHPRWGKVYAVGPEQNELIVGQYVLVAHGRWTHGVVIKEPKGQFTIRKVDVNDILAVSDEEILDETMGTPL